MIDYDASRYGSLQEILWEEHGWSETWFYGVDPSPDTSWSTFPTSFHYSMRRERGVTVPVFRSCLIDGHGRHYSTDVSSLCAVGRRIIFLADNLHGHIDGYRDSAPYIEDMKIVGISPSFIGKEIEIVGFSGEVVRAKLVKNEDRQALLESEKIDLSFADRPHREYYEKTGEIRFGAFLLLWYGRVLFSRRVRKNPKKGSRIIGNRTFRKSSRIEMQLRLLRIILEGCAEHPNYKPHRINQGAVLDNREWLSIWTCAKAV